MLSSEADEEILDSKGVLRIKVWGCTRVSVLTKLIMDKAHSFRYSINPRESKMYHGLKQYF